MKEPYILRKAGDYITAKDWNDMQGIIREALNAHTHSGEADQGLKLTGEAIDSTTPLTVNGLDVTGDLKVDKSGNVGIGTKNPKARLTIQNGRTSSSAQADGKTFFVSGPLKAGTKYDGGIEFRNVALKQGVGFGSQSIYATGSNENQPLHIYARGTSPLTLNAYGGGNVGIGTDDPKARLDVRGEIFGKLWHSIEYTWVNGSNPVKMIPSTCGIAFLTYVQGKFAGGGEIVKVYVDQDGYWYLGGHQGGAGASIMAKARCIGMPPPDYRRLDQLPKAPVQKGLILQLSGDTYIGGDGWHDISGKHHQALKHPGCTMAKFFEVKNYSGKNFNVMRFDKNGGMILPDSLKVNKPFTIIIVDRYYGTVQGRTLQSRSAEVNWLIGKHSGHNGCYMGKAWLPGRLKADKNKFYINTASLNDNKASWYLDGESKSTIGGVVAPGQLGFCAAGTYGGEKSEADIAAVLIWDRVLSDKERQKVEKWLAEKYGIKLKHS